MRGAGQAGAAEARSGEHHAGNRAERGHRAALQAPVGQPVQVQQSGRLWHTGAAGAVGAAPAIGCRSRACCLRLRARSIVGFTQHCTTYVLLAAFGAGADELEKDPVMKGPDWSSAKLLEQPTCLHYKIGTPAEAAKLPPDLLALHQRANLRSFLSVPIGTDHEVLGSLMIAKEEADGFDVDWCGSGAGSACRKGRAGRGRAGPGRGPRKWCEGPWGWGGRG
jgi:hypothetical protein